MKTATLDAGGMLSLLDYQAVEKQLGRIPGVQRATASVASNSVTVEYDETVTSVATLKAKINECGFHCTGQIMPKHVCEPRPVDEHGMHIGHAAHEPAGAPAAATAAVTMSHDMAHEMGHGAGMDMQAIVRDMRNRFWISLVFTVPIFIYSPMGNMFAPPAPPFGWRLDLWLFFLASAAILYPAWPFVIAAIRALRNGILNMAVLVLLSVGTSSALAPPFSSKATSSMKHRRCFSSSSCSVIGWRCGRERVLRERSGRCSIWRHQWRQCCATAGKLRSQQPRFWWAKRS
jgi:Cu2+-exporting ATPase